MIVYLDNIRLRISHRVARQLAKTSITPNQVTVFRFLAAAPLCGYLFSRGTYLFNILGLCVYVILAVADWVDGELARLTGQSSALGKFLDDTLDRILVLVVLGSLFYAQASYGDSQIWSVLAIAFFSVYFLLTTLLYDFDRMFGLDFSRYAEISENVRKSTHKSKSIDLLLVNFLDVHRNSVTKFCFCISYPLLLGIVINQLLLTFVFITFVFGLRAIGILFIIYRVVKEGETASPLTEILRALKEEGNG